jgi:hypothetical protein
VTSPFTPPLSLFGPQLPSAQPIPAVPPGDPGAIAAAARTYAAAADRMGALSGQITGIVDRTTGTAWSGMAAQAYIGNAMQVSAEFGNARNALGEGALVLATYARELTEAQAMAKSAGTSMGQLNDQVGALSTQVAASNASGTGGLILAPKFQQMAGDIRDGQRRVASMAADAMTAAHAAAHKAAAGFERVSKSTISGEQASAAARQQAAQAAAEKAAKAKQHHSMWAIGGLVLGDIVLTGVNVAQLGLDPVTDGAEVADTGGLIAEGTDVAATTAAAGTASTVTATAEDEAAALAEEVGSGSVKRLVIGRMKDLTDDAIGEDEYTILDQLTPDLGEPQANWIRNSSVLRNEIRNGVTEIRDASPGDTGGQFLNAERLTLENKGWIYDAVTHLWKAPIP